LLETGKLVPLIRDDAFGRRHIGIPEISGNHAGNAGYYLNPSVQTIKLTRDGLLVLTWAILIFIKIWVEIHVVIVSADRGCSGEYLRTKVAKPPTDLSDRYSCCITIFLSLYV
jgi:hypothetical protein